MYFILSGSVRSYLIRDGNDITDYFFFENSFATDYASYYSQTPAVFYLETMEQCAMLQLKRDHFLRVHFTVSHLMLKFKQKAMTQEEYLQLAADRWPELKALEAKGDFYTYEKRFAQIMKELELAVLQAHIGQVPKNHRKKSLSPPRLVK